jgi:hypothetical protein
VSGGTFNIGSQQAGAIFQSGGDQSIHHGEGTMSIDTLNAVSQLRGAVEAAALTSGDRRGAHEALDEVDSELRKDVPEKSSIARHLERMTDLLARAGGLAGATNALQCLAKWLGPAGAGLLGMLI